LGGPVDTASELPFGVALPARSPWDTWLAGLDPGDLSAGHKVEVGIPMRDGLELAADIHLPAAANLPAPAVVLATPYDKGVPIDSVEMYRRAGFVGVIYDIRGRGKSEGVFNPFAADGLDGHDVVEWVARQEWCDGGVAVSGLSYGGWTAWATIRERPAALKAAITTSPAGRWQQEIPYTHGCLPLSFVFWFALTRRRINDASRSPHDLVDTLPVAAIGEAIDPAGPAWADMLAHDALDDFWRARRWDGEYDFDLPVLHVTGWHDRDDMNGAFHHYEQMMATSPARDSQWLLVGPWSHASTRNPTDLYSGVEAPGGAVDMDAIHVRFLDRFLRGERNGVDDEPRVRLYDPGARAWKVRPGWRAGTVAHDLHLGPDGTLGAAPGEAGETSYEYDPCRPNGVPFDTRAEFWELPLDLGELESQDGVLTWTSAPLERPLTVHGWGELDLFAATDGEDTEWHAKLADVDAEGTSLCVSWGCLRASHADDPGAPRPLTPGEVRRYAVELSPSFHTFAPGHRIRLVLASSEYPWFARNLNRFGPIAEQADPRTARNTIHHGGALPSRLRLTVEE
jgi:putative CocE/NonD family hydrolase